MTYEIFPTTAEHIVAATDAVLLINKGCDEIFVSEFLDIPQESANNALKMAEQLGLIRHDSLTNLYYPCFPFATYLVTSREQQKSVIVRLVLEQYEPYKMFKNRLDVTGYAHLAAEQVKVYYGLTAHRETIKDTITSLGTYAQSLNSEGAGLYRIAEPVDNTQDFFLRIGEIVAEREKAEIIVRRLLGERAQSWVDKNDTLEPLITAYQKLEGSSQDPRSPILYAGNAFESFLVKFATHRNTSLTGASGINAKVDRLSDAGLIKTKHKFMAKFLGHIRNACDHGIDQEINSSWDISSKTSHEYVHLTMTSIRVIVDTLDGMYRI